MLENSSKTPKSAHNVDFEKSRLDYCAKVYERVLQRKEVLEKKTQFLLSFITIFLGAIFLKIEFFEKLGDLINKKSAFVNEILFLKITVVCLAASLLFSLLTVLQTVRLQVYRNEYPSKLVSSLFASHSEYFEGETEAEFLKSIAMSYALATEQNRKVNDRKARWVKVCWFCVLAAVISFTTFLLAYAYLSIL